MHDIKEHPNLCLHISLRQGSELHLSPVFGYLHEARGNPNILETIYSASTCQPSVVGKLSVSSEYRIEGMNLEKCFRTAQ